MAEQFRLTAEEQQTLKALVPDLNAARQTIAKLKAMGIPVDELEERVETAARIQSGLLQQFSSPVSLR